MNIVFICSATAWRTRGSSGARMRASLGAISRLPFTHSMGRVFSCSRPQGVIDARTTCHAGYAIRRSASGWRRSSAGPTRSGGIAGCVIGGVHRMGGCSASPWPSTTWCESRPIRGSLSSRSRALALDRTEGRHPRTRESGLQAGGPDGLRRGCQRRSRSSNRPRRFASFGDATGFFSTALASCSWPQRGHPRLSPQRRSRIAGEAAG